jgi:hypothetical protein
MQIIGSDRAACEELAKRALQMSQLELPLVANDVEHAALCEAGVAAAAAGEKVVVVDDQLVGRWVPAGADDSGQPVSIGSHFGTHVHEFPYGQESAWPHHLVVVEPDEELRITGQLIESAYPTVDESGVPAIGFQFNDTGRYLFGLLTTSHQPRAADRHRTCLAILINGEIIPAPSIEVPITGGAGIIQGSFTEEEVESLAAALDLGELIYPLTLTENTEPADVQEDTDEP